MAKRKSTGTPAVLALQRAEIPHVLHAYEHRDDAGAFGDEAAAALAVDAHRIFKTLIAESADRLVVAVVPVAAQLDLKALAAATGAKKAQLAEPATAERSTGYVLGGISPIGQRTALATVLDASATDFDTVYVSAGRRGLQVELSPAGLATVTDAIIARIART